MKHKLFRFQNNKLWCETLKKEEKKTYNSIHSNNVKLLTKIYLQQLPLTCTPGWFLWNSMADMTSGANPLDIMTSQCSGILRDTVVTAANTDSHTFDKIYLLDSPVFSLLFVIFFYFWLASIFGITLLDLVKKFMKN